MFKKVTDSNGPSDPEQVLTGVCQTCRKGVEVLCRDAVTNTQREGQWGARGIDNLKQWGDTPFTGCAGCGSVVYLTVRPVQRFKLKPRIVTAEQWQLGKLVGGVNQEVRTDGTVVKAFVQGFRGPIYLSPGDWVVTDDKGMRSVVKEKDFAQLYEELKE